MSELKVVCAWCPETPEAERWKLLGVPISHGICDFHYRELMARIHTQDANQGMTAFPVETAELARTTIEAVEGA